MLADASMSFRGYSYDYNPEVLTLLIDHIGMPINIARRLIYGLRLERTSAVLRLSFNEYEEFARRPGNQRIRGNEYYKDIILFQNWTNATGLPSSDYSEAIHSQLRSENSAHYLRQIVHNNEQASPSSSLRSRSIAEPRRARSQSPSPKSVTFNKGPFPSDESSIEATQSRKNKNE